MKPIPSLSRTLALTAPAVLLTLSGAQAASDYLLEIEGIKGESVDQKHKDWIEIESFSWGCTNSGGAAKSVTFTLKKRIDKSSPLLFLACAKGNHIPHATLTVRKSNAAGGKTDYYQITLTDILVSSYQSSASPPSGGTAGPPELPADQLSLNFTKISYSYTRVDENGVQLEDTIKVEQDFSAPTQ